MKLDYDIKGASGRGSGLMALLPPKVNISTKGYVPTTLQVFAIRLPCSGLEKAEVTLSLKLNVSAPSNKYNDIYLDFKRNKFCEEGNFPLVSLSAKNVKCSCH